MATVYCIDEKKYVEIYIGAKKRNRKEKTEVSKQKQERK